jgi:hypothetical protein
MAKIPIATRESEHPKMIGLIVTTTRNAGRNYESHGSHSQVAAGYRDNNDNPGDEHQKGGYRSDNSDKMGPSKSFRPRTSRDYNQSPEDILIGPCHMHYAYVDRKRVSNCLMRDCHTFLKLQEAIGSKQSEVRNQGYTGTPGSVAYNAPPPPPLLANGGTQPHG